jgi:hypothetical protein
MVSRQYSDLHLKISNEAPNTERLPVKLLGPVPSFSFSLAIFTSDGILAMYSNIPPRVASASLITFYCFFMAAYFIPESPQSAVIDNSVRWCGLTTQMDSVLRKGVMRGTPRRALL